MNLRSKRLIVNKIARIANELGYDTGRLSKAGMAKHAKELSDAVDQLRAVQARLALDVHHETAHALADRESYIAT